MGQDSPELQMGSKAHSLSDIITMDRIATHVITHRSTTVVLFGNTRAVSETHSYELFPEDVEGVE